MQELHAQERPVALQTSLMANINRDSKKNRTPYKIEDFFLYQPREQQNLPQARYGAAAAELIRLRAFPSWGLFCYKELMCVNSGNTPSLVAFISEDALLLAPTKEKTGFRGMLIAKESAGGKWTEFTSLCGRKELLYVPAIETKIIAKEDVILRSQ